MTIRYIPQEINDIKGLLLPHKEDVNAMRLAFFGYLTANKKDSVGLGSEKFDELIEMYRKNGLVGYLNFMGI